MKTIAEFDTIAKFKPNSVIITKRWISSERSEETTQNEASLANLLKDGAKSENMNGYLSDASKRNLKNLAENFLMSVELTTGMKYATDSKTKNGEKSFSLLADQVKRISGVEYQQNNQVYPTFITLTLPSKQLHHDNFIKNECLDPFIEWLKSDREYITRKGKGKGLLQGCNVKVYLWRAETQKNGQLHFHIIVDRWIDKDQIRWRWNQIVNRLGYVDRFRNVQLHKYRNGFACTAEEIESNRKKIQDKLFFAHKNNEIPKTLHPAIEAEFIKTFKNGRKSFSVKKSAELARLVLEYNYRKKVENNFTDPPSTQVIPIQNAKSVTAYVTKYISKSAEEIKPKLKENQEFVSTEEFGMLKKYIVNYRYELSLDGQEVKIETGRQEYKPKFETRKVIGRLWGRSDSLFGIKAFEKAIYTYKLVEEPVYETRVENKKISHTITDLWGNQSLKYEYKEVLITDTHYKRQAYGTEDKVGWNYIDSLKNIVGKAQIDEATNKVGGSFVAFGGQIIPVYKIEEGKVKYQKHYMQENAPELYSEYLNHYGQIFKTLYA
ncbi:hypothetical protein SAMN04515674_104256 [Pseudarcicella hirudinis]|uniref:Uncharacterized protein n=1 Tax=Pseudarcicella hirudinis TaxID=1079859 RepID=A0A1I5RUR3_9BACT|nr:hypothetical protein [Pseudarcicella hirudinis]SFP62262.1 hypothetical protein SAMN04515674_104256 [Pseudarcicella hirudinis]